MGKDEGGKKRKQFKKPKQPLVFQVGRVCCINYGEDNGKICTIVDFVDATRALVDGPHTLTGVQRQTIPFKRLSITPIKIKISRSLPSKRLGKAFQEQKIAEKWEKLPWAKKLKRKALRDSLSDFDRFKVMLLKKRKARILNKEFSLLRREVQIQKKFNPNGKNNKLRTSKIQQYYIDKAEGKDVEKPKVEERDPTHGYCIRNKIPKTRRRVRSRKRSKKNTEAKLKARRAYAYAKRRDHRRAARQPTAEEREVKEAKKLRLIEKRAAFRKREKAAKANRSPFHEKEAHFKRKARARKLRRDMSEKYNDRLETQKKKIIGKKSQSRQMKTRIKIIGTPI